MEADQLRSAGFEELKMKGEPMAFLELNERFSCMHVEWHVSPI